MKLLISLIFLSSGPCFAIDEFHPGTLVVGTSMQYSFENTETVFSLKEVDGVAVAGDPLFLQQIRLESQIDVSSTERKLTVLSSTKYREGTLASIGANEFTNIREGSSFVPEKVEYTYLDDSDALTRLQNTFEKLYGIKTESGKSFGEQIQADHRASALFFKLQDVHQMQESVAQIPDGMTPGQVHVIPAQERTGFGGRLIVPAAQLFYEKTVDLNGVRCAFFKSVVMGLQFIQESRTTFTNFFFSAYVPLEGPQKGLLVLGEGQETATVFARGPNPKPQVILQRQFSIRVK